jgi:DNA-binding response OmpR family regulator
MRVLLVEDDNHVAAALRSALRRRGYDVVVAGTVADALAAPAADLVLLDLNLPDGDGTEVCRQLRRRDPQVAIIAVTARGAERDRVTGLLGGADDYVVKPFSMAELQARIAAVLRRSVRAGPAAAGVAAGPVRIDPAARRVSVDGRDVALTPKEFDILTVLARTPDAVVSRDRLMLEVWHTTWVGRHNLEVHVGSLRAKLGRPELVETVRGVGYRLRADRDGPCAPA